MKKRFLKRLLAAATIAFALSGGFLWQNLSGGSGTVEAATNVSYPQPYSYQGQVSVDFDTYVVTQTDNMYTPGLGASDVVLTSSSYYGQSGHVTTLYYDGNTTWAQIHFSDGNAFWIDVHVLLEPFYQANYFSGGKSVEYLAKIVTQNDGMFFLDLGTGHCAFPSIMYYGQIGHVTEEHTIGDTTWSLITFPSGVSFWVDRHSLQVTSNTELSASTYTPDMSDNSYWKDYITAGANTGGRFYTIKAENGSYPLFSGEFGDYSHVTANSDRLGGLYVLATKEKVLWEQFRSKVTAVYCTPDNIHWYWIDKRAFSSNEDFSHNGITAHASLKGTGVNGAIKWYVSAADPLADEIKAAITQWNTWLPGTFEPFSSSSAIDVNINIDEADLVKTYNSNNYMNYWACTDMNWNYYLSSGLIVPNSQKVQILLNNAANTPGENNLVAQASADSQGVTNIITHELGHALGLDHSNDYLPANNLMNSFSNGTKDSINTLSQQQLNVLKLIRGPLNWTYTGMTNKTATLKAMDPDIGTSESFSCN